jgi:hypothetical protein
MSPEERATHGLPEEGWEDEVRRRYSRYGAKPPRIRIRP